jgi:hypothetical protein
MTNAQKAKKVATLLNNAGGATGDGTMTVATVSSNVVTAKDINGGTYTITCT